MPNLPVIDLALQDVALHVTNLPFTTTSLIGRQEEVAQLAALLQRNEVRLVTLNGAGGTGKTRLALQVASTLFNHFVDGIYFVDLAPIQAPAFVLPTIVHTLSLAEDSATSALDALKNYLRTKRVLLVLDNFEHLVAAAPLVSALLTASTALKVLATSRSALHLSGEHEFPVLPLVVPDLAHLPTVALLAHNPAVMLFIQRVQAVKPDFQLTASNAASVAELCVRLDGLPLAIELAAARSKMLSPQTLLAWLGQPLLLLTTGARDLPARQQTLRATIEWSYKLLDGHEQQLFRRLAVFVGGCTLEAIAAICYEHLAGAGAGDAEVTIDLFSVHEQLTALVEKNLLVRVEQEDGEARFKFLALVRDYAKECLAANGEAEHFQQRHLTYYVALAETAEPKLTSHEQLVWLVRLEAEHDNLRAALAASCDLPQGAEQGLRLASGLWWFWFVRCHNSDWRHWLELLLERTATAPATASTDRLRAIALYRTALLLYGWDDLSKAEAMAQQSLQLAEALGERDCRGWAHHVLGELANLQGAYRRGRLQLAEGLQHFRLLDDRRGICWSFYQLGWTDLQEGDLVSAPHHFQAGLAVARDMGDRYNIGAGLYGLGAIAQAQGRFEESNRYLNETLQWFRIIDSPYATLMAIRDLAYNAQRMGDYAAARIGLAESLVVAEKLGLRPYIAISLAGLATTASMYGRLSLCAQVFGCAHAHLLEDFMASFDASERAYYEEILAATRAELGEQAFAEAWNAGVALTPGEALALVNAAALDAAAEEASASTSGAKPPPAISLPMGLSQREADVLRLLAQGLTNAEMAEKLIVSPFTINAHLRNIYNKIGTSVRREAIRFAHEHNLI